MLNNWFVNIIFFSFCIIDAKFYKVRNDMVISALILFIIYKCISYSTNQMTHIIIFNIIMVFIFSQLVLLFLSLIIPIHSGDIKLIGLILAITGINDGLSIIFLGSIFSLFLIYRKIVEKMPMGFAFYVGYLIHSFFRSM